MAFVILLLIDSSGPSAGVALVENGVVRYEALAVNAFTHSQSILPIAEEAYRRTGLALADTDYFAVTVGPGSFTGVRIGVATVKGLAHATHKPCIGVDALESIAYGAQPFSGLLCPMQDARAGQVYGALFEGGTLERRMEDTPLALEDYVKQAAAYGKPLLFLGDGMPVHREKIKELLGEQAQFAPAHLSCLRPAAAAMLAWEKRDTAVDYLALQPLYLRAPSAERRKNLVEAAHG